VEGSGAVTHTTPVTEEERAAHLKFVPAVRTEFGFLADLGFREMSASAYIVDFASDSVQLRIAHGRLSYELSAMFARRDHDEEMHSSYSYGAYLTMVDPAAAAGYRDFAATTPDAVRHGVAKLAADVRAATPLLTGDATTYDELAHHRMLAGEAQGARSRRHAYGPRAEAAWQAKDWAEVVAAYSTYENDLTESERRRLELARRRAAGDGS
jgi:hypothetical protein